MSSAACALLFSIAVVGCHWDDDDDEIIVVDPEDDLVDVDIVPEGELVEDDEFPGANVAFAICSPTSGRFTQNVTNPFFPLRACSRTVLEGNVDGVLESVQITVLNETRMIAGVTTLVVEELHTEDGEVVELSRNFFVQAEGEGSTPGGASPRNGTVCYFGEEVDIVNDDGTITHEGAWLAGANGAMPGIIMPGTVAVGQAYLQEVAPGVAEDRAWHVAIDNGELFVNEDSPLEPGVISEKVYRRDTGLIADNELTLVSQVLLSPCDCVPSELPGAVRIAALGCPH
jgi:hypothetical protein